jgi:cholesterol transport system auxiliary component
MNRCFVLLAALLLSACVGGAGNSVPSVTYDFGLPVARLAVGGTWPGLSLEVRSPSWVDSTNVDYRLAYADPLTRRQYVGSRWAGAPAQLIAQRLRQQLGVVSATANSATDCLIRVELQEFSQVFDSPQSSRGVLTASVSLIDGKRRVVAERLAVIDKPALGADASGGVQALVAASTEFGRLLSDWLLELEKNGGLKSCRLA